MSANFGSWEKLHIANNGKQQQCSLQVHQQAKGVCVIDYKHKLTTKWIHAWYVYLPTSLLLTIFCYNLITRSTEQRGKYM